MIWRSQDPDLTSEKSLPEDLKHVGEDFVGSYSCHGFDGSEKVNQDRGSIEYPLGGDLYQALFCVVDGHGPNGAEVAQSTLLSLHTLVHEDSRTHRRGSDAMTQHVHSSNPQDILMDAMLKADEMIKQDEKLGSSHSGCCAVAVLMFDRQAWIANCGDCRVVLGRVEEGSGILRPVRLTALHRPDEPLEKQRLIDAGHCIANNTVSALDGEQVHMLRMSRCIGDHALKEKHPNGVIAMPEATTYEFADGDRFLVLASDGLWDVMSEGDVVAMVEEAETPTEACKHLIKEAQKAWHLANANYCDDITVTVISLPCFSKNTLSDEEEPGAPAESGRRSILVLDPTDDAQPSPNTDSIDEQTSSISRHSSGPYRLFEIYPPAEGEEEYTYQQSQPSQQFGKPRPRALSMAPRVRRHGSYGASALLPLGPVRTETRAKSCYASPHSASSLNSTPLTSPLRSPNPLEDANNNNQDEADDWCSQLTGAEGPRPQQENESDDEDMAEWMG